MLFALFSLGKLKNILFVIFEGQENVTSLSWLHYLDFILHYSSFLNKVLEPEERLLVTEIYINLISSFDTSNIFYLFLLYNFGR